MNSFGEVRTCLVIMFSTLLIVTTRARFIYHADPAQQCLEAKVPCSGHQSEDSCKDYCQSNGFVDGRCGDYCCLCFSGPGALEFAPLDQRLRRMMIPQRPGMIPLRRVHSHPMRKMPTIQTTTLMTTSVATTDAGVEIKAPIISVSSSPKIKRENEEFNRIDVETEKTDLQNLHQEKNDAYSSICLTPDCVKASYGLLINMDETIDPCDDFYNFACGNFEKTSIIPDDKSELTLISSLTDKLHLQIRSMIEEIDTREGEKVSQSARLVKNLYSSCENQEILQAKGIQPLQALLKKIGTGWPVMEGDKWKPSPNFEWTDLVLKFKDEGVVGAYLLGIGVGNDVKNSGKRIITIGEPQLSFGREQMANPVFMAAYHKYQIDLVSFLGADRKSAEVEMGAVFQLEKHLANISLPRELSRAHPLTFYNPVKIFDLQQRFPHINWVHYIASLFPEEVSITEDEVVSLSVPPHLVNLLRVIEMTPQRTLVNYLIWRASSSLVPYLGETANSFILQFNAKTTGQRVKPPKWSECVGMVTSTLAHAVGRLYVEKHFNEKSRTEAIKMFRDIHQTFDSVLAEAEWMDPITKEKAQEKANAMRSFIAYPEELMDEEKLMNLYEGLELSSDNLFGNVLNVTKSGTKYMLSKLRKIIDPNDWVGHGKPAQVNAFYSPNQNFIQFPSGIMQGHFFSFDQPHYLNFGAIGWVYGHELIHGFDDQGSRFDLKGDLKDWWHPATKLRYQERKECTVQQYSKYNFTDLVTNTTTMLNGAITQGENIADNGGIKLAYRGYQQWVARNWEEKRLPGLEKYTPNQLFWISAGNNWCSKHRSVALHHTMKTGVHPPGKFRVMGSFSNSIEFAKDFQCPVGSQMNPVKKCSVW